MLEQVDEALWIADGDIVSFHGFAYSTRSVIARLQNGDLWVWSPIKLGVDLRTAVDRLGPVRHLVSPNKLHHLYLRDWHSAYPDAQMWGPQSTIRKLPGLSFREALQDTPPIEWYPDIDEAWFRGSFALDEVVFLHRPSATVIVADLIQTFSDRFLREHWGRWRFIAWFGGITEKQAGAPRDWRTSFINRAPARVARKKVLSWSCQRVIVAHGEWQRSDGHAFLEHSLRWLG